RNVSRESSVKVGDHEISTPVRGEKAELTSPGWLRGLAWLSDTRILVGSSPATLFEIDLLERKVVGEMQLEEDVGWTIHGIYVDERKCCESMNPAEPAGNSTSQKTRREKPPRGLRKLLQNLRP